MLKQAHAEVVLQLGIGERYTADLSVVIMQSCTMTTACLYGPLIFLQKSMIKQHARLTWKGVEFPERQAAKACGKVRACAYMQCLPCILHSSSQPTTYILLFHRQ